MSIKNGDLPTMPSGVLQDGHNCGHYPLNTGITKREQFAMAAMQGILSGLPFEKLNVAAQNAKILPDVLLAKMAIDAADALLAELERTK